jgi:hypothetical protein
MEIIDEEGRLFGAVNVVDALVVLLVLAVGLAGFTLVAGGGPSGPMETRYATLDLGSQPAYVAEQIDVGDTDPLGEGPGNVTITDTYFTTNDSRAYALARVAITQRVRDDEFVVRDEPLRVGREIPFVNESYALNTTIQNVGGDATFETQRRPVLVTSVISAQTARDIDQGDVYRVAGRPIVTVENVAVYGTDEPNRKRVYVGLSVETLSSGDGPQFGGRTLREGATLPVRTSEYTFDGEVVRVGALTQPGEETTRTVTLQLRNVRPERANSVREGLTETNAGETVARVTDVQVEPAIVALTSESGQIYRREHPVNKTVTLAVELQVRESEGGLLFKGRQLQAGNAVTLDLGTTTVTATVAELDAP